MHRAMLIKAPVVPSGVRYVSRSSREIESMIRVNHAGELGADRIYAGQMAVLGRTSVGPLIQHMWEQEKEHKAKFEDLINNYRVRPTALVPIWNVAGFVLGAGSALLGPKAAMACTVAVESVIVDHYNDQIRTLMSDQEANKELLQVIQKFRDDEQEHHDAGLGHGAEQTPFYKIFTEGIKLGCKAAIAISKVV
ncbi:5-demethoxyubiquinone hydroxylase, mitochondrial isoform X3 [Zootermopsis nevadensis]|nr:5-demethoxyubiquinone hydroxylase, mitochondrial isoform X3 [Zootermopsis nevadensis]